MRVVEYRLPLPMEVEEYHVAQLYMVAKSSREDSEKMTQTAKKNGVGKQGVEIIKNEPYEGDGRKGQYTYKIMHIYENLPGWVRALIPSSWGKKLNVHEEAWNAYPYCKTQYKIPLFPDRFSMSVESMHLQDDGSTENPLNLSPEALKERDVQYVDIVNDPISSKDYLEAEDPKKFESKLAGRGPLTEEWRKTSKPLMCAYKVCSVEFKLFGFQNKIEKFIHNSGLRDVFFKYHRKAFCWMDEWFNMSISDVRAYEDETKRRLDAFFGADSAASELSVDASKVEQPTPAS